MDADSPLLENGKNWREIVGSLIYAMLCREAFAKPTRADLNLSEHVPKYIKGTLSYIWIFQKSDHELNLVGFCDSGFANAKDRKRIAGYFFRMSALQTCETKV